MRRVSLFLTALALVLVSIIGALSPRATVAQEASPVTDQPSPPVQPATGPGGTESTFPSVRMTSLGDDAGGGRVFEPTTDAAGGAAVTSEPLPLILLLDGCCYRPEGSTVSGGGGDGGAGFQTWIEHLVRRGAIVVYPIYRGSLAQDDIATAMQAALAVLDGDDHAQPDPEHTAVIGF